MTPVSPSLSDLVDLLGYTARNHEVVSHNIANVNTPDFKTLTLGLSDSSARDRNAGEAEPLEQRLQVREEEGLNVRIDGNNVDIDRELGRLGKNAILHQTFTELLSVNLDAYRRAIQLR
ncbi:MAG: flagellar basal body rod protein FlgB [Planctomycetaceae bacterium]